MRRLQDAIRADGLSSPSTTAALMCGMKPMTEAVTAALTDAGVDPKKIIMNF